MASKYNDISAIIQVIGNVYMRPEILDLNDMYVITEQDFSSEFHKIIFGSIYKLHENGANKISLSMIHDFLENRPKQRAIYDLNKGDEYLQQVSAAAAGQALTFDYYYKRLKKMSLLRAYDNIGMDVSFLYDPDNILDLKKKEAQEEWLDNSDLGDIADQIDNKIAAIRDEYTESNEYAQSFNAGDGIEDLIVQLEKNPDIGVPLFGNYINTITRGARLGKFYLRSAPTGVGKAVPNDTYIPTPIGWRYVRDIKVGDYLYGQDGKPTKVLNVFPQKEKKDIWKIKFGDGRKTRCCEDHLWEYSEDGKSYKVDSTKNIYSKMNTGKDSKFYIKLNKEVQNSEKVYSIDPYVMGALIGSGNFRFRKDSHNIRFSSENSDMPDAVAELLGCLAVSDGVRYYILNSGQVTLKTEEILSGYPDLWNAFSEKKYIPKEYLNGSIDQRYALLQGLLDANGAINSKGRIIFKTVSSQVMNDIGTLCRSLGMVPVFSYCDYAETYDIGSYTNNICFKVTIYCEKEKIPFAFRVKKKKDAAINYLLSDKESEYKGYLAITEIEPTKEKTKMTCFTVDNADHLFLINDYIVTHNTRSMVADACNIACSKIYDEQFGWVSNGSPCPTVFISTEQDKSEIQTLMLAFLSGVNEENILNGKYQEGEREKVFAAAKIIKESPLYLEILPEFNLQDIEDTIKRRIRENHVQYIFHDYIHTSIKILEEISSRAGKIALREDNVLFMISAKLKDICVKYNVFIMSSTQLNGDYKEAKVPDQNLLRGAKSIADKIDYGSILLPIKEVDLASLQNLLSTNPNLGTPNIKLSIYKNRRSKYKDVLLWCVADLGTCRIQPVFLTDYSYELKSIEDIKIKVQEESAF